MKVQEGRKKKEILSPGIACSCQDCQRIYGYQGREASFYDDIQLQEVIDEGSFSRWPCQLCNSGLAGMRYIAHKMDLDREGLDHLEVCIDCYIKLA